MIPANNTTELMPSSGRPLRRCHLAGHFQFGRRRGSAGMADGRALGGRYGLPELFALGAGGVYPARPIFRGAAAWKDTQIGAVVHGDNGCVRQVRPTTHDARGVLRHSGPDVAGPWCVSANQTNQKPAYKVRPAPLVALAQSERRLCRSLDCLEPEMRVRIPHATPDFPRRPGQFVPPSWPGRPLCSVWSGLVGFRSIGSAGHSFPKTSNTADAGFGSSTAVLPDRCGPRAINSGPTRRIPIVGDDGQAVGVFLSGVVEFAASPKRGG